MTTQEFETKILDIDISSLKQNLFELGFICSKPRHFVRRWVFSLPNKQEDAWLRVIEGSKNKKQVALAYKSYESYKIGGIREHELVVNNEAAAVCGFLEQLGCSLIAEQHSYEEQYIYSPQQTVVIDIQEWPHIPPYIEIEGQNEKEVVQTLTDLGFNTEDSRPITTKMVYEKYGINLHDYKLLSFD